MKYRALDSGSFARNSTRQSSFLSEILNMSTSKFLNLYLITFNCGRELINPEAFASHLFDGLSTSSTTSETSSDLPDLIVLNLQEIAPIAYGFLGGSFVTPYLDRFRKAIDLAVKRESLDDSDFGETPHYVNIRAGTIGLTGIMVFVRDDLLSYVSDIMTASVGVGVQEMGNKGAIGVRISWKLNDSSSQSDEEENHPSEKMDMTFVSAHLAPMEGELERRNKDYKDIVRGLVFTSDHATSSTKQADGQTPPLTDEGEEDVPLLQGTPQTSHSSSSSPIGIYTSTSHLFFAGDLNYRTSNTAPSKSGSDKSHFPSPKNHSSLLSKDQLTIALQSNNTLHGLTEQKITFPPTYKYNFPSTPSDNPSSSSPTSNQDPDLLTESDFQTNGSYPFASHRWPSYCDRILFSSSESPSNSITPQTYTALPLFKTSDHRPVALHVQVPLQPVKNEAFASHRPVSIDPAWKGRRDVARRKEIAVGALSYLGLTWEGRGAGVAALLVVLGAVWILRGLSV